MTEPDFKQIARTLAAKHADMWDEDGDGNQVQFVAEDTLKDDIIDLLRQVWNARGAADIAAIDDVAHTNEKAVANAIKSLDR